MMRSRVLSALAGAGIVALWLGLAGCKGHQISGKELQDLKQEEIQKDTTLSPQEKYRILGIQARSKSEFLREVQRILAQERGSGKKAN